MWAIENTGLPKEAGVQVAVILAHCHNRAMLGFFDESGDPGLKIAAGSSRYFVVALVTFADDDEAIRCDRFIAELRNELHLAHSYEFHFSKNPKRVREAFLQAVYPFNFMYHIFALDKDLGMIHGLQLNSIQNLYQYTAGLVFENARPFLSNATIIIDKRGDKKFREELARHLRSNVKSVEGERIIKRVKQQESHRNNLLQLADYVASIGNRAISGKLDAMQLQDRYLRSKEVTREIWPK